MQITTTVLNGGTPVSGAAVSIRVTNPVGAVTALSKSTDASGKAKGSYSLNRTSRKGTYRVTGTATKGSSSVTTTTSFVVQ